MSILDILGLMNDFELLRVIEYLERTRKRGRQLGGIGLNDIDRRVIFHPVSTTAPDGKNALYALPTELP
jgi:hypothetical protein